MKYIQRKKM